MWILVQQDSYVVKLKVAVQGLVLWPTLRHTDIHTDIHTYICGEILHKQHLAFRTIKGLCVFVFSVLLLVLPEMSGGKDDFVYLQLTYRIFSFIYVD
jgi:hypothetical protein